jgi:type VI protein secretion system component Hcp
MSEETSGASRRDVLRGGGAVGVGALVGAMALTNSSEIAADAAGTNNSMLVSFSGISPKTLRLDSVNFGGDNPGGTPTPDVVVLTLRSGAQSPFLLQAFAQQTNLTATIKGYGVNATGGQVLDFTITCSVARIVHYHLSASSGSPTDSVHLRFNSIDLEWNPNLVHFTWTPIA